MLADPAVRSRLGLPRHSAGIALPAITMTKDGFLLLVYLPALLTEDLKVRVLNAAMFSGYP